MASAIEVERIAKTFRGGVRALDGVSFEVAPGTVFGLLGPNGAGKTTIVRILTTILQPDAGRAAVLGHDVSARPAAVRRVIGLAGQFAAVDENLTAVENLAMVGRLNHLSRSETGRRTGELLDRFDLAEAARRPLKTFSGGMRRRLDLAAALMASPPVLFLDEPTTGLDPQSRNDLWEVIATLVGGGTTVLLTTQYLEEADRLAHQIAVVDHGHLIAQGTPGQLKDRLGTTVLEIGLGDVATARRVAQALGGVGTDEARVVGTTVELPVSDGPRAAMEALRRLDQDELEPTAFVLREPSLDDVFLSLTGHRTEPTTGPADRSTGERGAGGRGGGGPAGRTPVTGGPGADRPSAPAGGRR